MATSDREGRGEQRRAAPSSKANAGDSKQAAETTPHAGRMNTLPEQFGPYRIKKALGGGGMGAVYLVENTKLEREEALKIPHFDDMGQVDSEVKKRFLVEARSAAKLDHANLCQVYDADEIDGVLFMTMRYLKGRPLSDYAGVPQPPRKAVEVVIRLAQALEFAHGKGVVHRDLKPNNVMMCPGSGPTVMDFGLARQTKQQDNRLTQSGTMLGTPSYMPPEQVKGELDKMGPASDVYSLGVILYELLAGRLPFEGGMAEIFGKILYTEPPSLTQLRPDLNPALDEICRKAMAREVTQRYPTMKAFAGALGDFFKNTATEGPGNLVVNPAAVKAAASPLPANLFQAQTMAPAPTTGSPRNILNAETVAPRNQIVNVETRGGGKGPTVNKAAGKSGTKRARPDREEEKSGISAGAIIGLVMCVFLVLGALGGVGGLIYALQQKKEHDKKDVVEQQIKPVKPVVGGPKEGPSGTPVTTVQTPRLKVETPPSLEITAGDTQPFLVKISRENCTGPVKLSFSGLPSGGQIKPLTLAAGSRDAYPNLVVAADTPAGTFELVVLAESENASVEVTALGKIPLRIKSSTTIAPPKTGGNDPKEDKKDGWVSLFNGKNLDGWYVEVGNARQWSVVDDAIVARSTSYRTRSHLLSRKDYSDFTLRLEYMVDRATHGAVDVRAINGEKMAMGPGQFLAEHPMIKVSDPARTAEPSGTTHWVKNDKTYCKPSKALRLPTGEWHSMEITVRGDSCTVLLAGEKVVDIRLESRVGQLVVPGLQRTQGKIGLQMNTGTIRFRRILIKELPRR
jgi:serine/threonine protein kinase